MEDRLDYSSFLFEQLKQSTALYRKLLNTISITIMPKSAKFYKNKEKLKAYLRRNKKENYAKGNFSMGVRYRKWEDWEKNILFKYKEVMTDRELAKRLSRTVQSIQIKRCYMLQGERL